MRISIIAFLLFALVSCQPKYRIRPIVAVDFERRVIPSARDVAIGITERSFKDSRQGLKRPNRPDPVAFKENREDPYRLCQDLRTRFLNLLRMHAELERDMEALKKENEALRLRGI